MKFGCACLVVSVCWVSLFSLIPSHALEARVPTYRAHGDIKTKSWLIGRDSFPVENAQYTNAQLSPSSEVYRVPVGEPTTIVFSLRNIGDKTFNVTSSVGYLRAYHKYTFAVDDVCPSIHPQNRFFFTPKKSAKNKSKKSRVFA